jgi:hypothetical protein
MLHASLCRTQAALVHPTLLSYISALLPGTCTFLTHSHTALAYPHAAATAHIPTLLSRIPALSRASPHYLVHPHTALVHPCAALMHYRHSYIVIAFVTTAAVVVVLSSSDRWTSQDTERIQMSKNTYFLESTWTDNSQHKKNSRKRGHSPTREHRRMEK